MENEQQQLEALHDIRRMMKDASKFLSLSGLSGVCAGIFALVGAGAGHLLLNQYYASGYELTHVIYFQLVMKIIGICLAVLVLSIFTGYYFSARKARKNDQKLFDHSSRKLLWSMIIPLAAGGLFCFSLLAHGNVMLISSAMLMFYGLALINSSKFTMHDIRYLGYLELLLGLLAGFFRGHGLLFWALGFGVLHIIYGTIMWFKYDRAH